MKYLICNTDRSNFILQDSIAAIEAVKGVDKCRKGEFIGAIFECDFQSGEGEVCLVRLGDQLDAITIDGSDRSAAEFAFSLQEIVSREMHIFDLSYSFDVRLGDLDDVDDLLSRMRD